MTDFFKSVEGITAAVAALIVALTPFIDKWQKKRRRRKGNDPKPGHNGGSPSLWVLPVSLVFGGIFIAMVAIHFWPDTVHGRQHLTVSAFKALEAKKYELAVSKAGEVISEYAGVASDRQTRLETEKTPGPPIGRVPEDRREGIFQEGLLNDVAACYFIKGRALEHLQRNAEARTNYEAAARLTYARTYDNSEDTFWSPAEGAKGRLNTLPR